MDFSNFQIRGCPPSATYIPNFITSEEEQLILSQVERIPKPKWTQLLNRRLVNYGGIPHPNGMVAEEIPEWLQVVIDKVNNLNIFESHRANHVLLNEYLPGQGIMPHTDGPLFYPIISTISCGSYTILEFIKREQTSNERVPNSQEGDTVEKVSQPKCFDRKVSFKILLEPRSLLILKDTLYSSYLHAIAEMKEDILCDRICNYENCETSHKMGDVLHRGTRVSLTIRHVPKTTKMKLKFY